MIQLSCTRCTIQISGGTKGLHNTIDKINRDDNNKRSFSGRDIFKGGNRGIGSNLVDAKFSEQTTRHQRYPHQ